MNIEQAIASVNRQTPDDRKRMLDAIKVSVVKLEKWLRKPVGGDLGEEDQDKILGWANGEYVMDAATTGYRRMTKRENNPVPAAVRPPVTEGSGKRYPNPALELASHAAPQAMLGAGHRHDGKTPVAVVDVPKKRPTLALNLCPKKASV